MLRTLALLAFSLLTLSSVGANAGDILTELTDKLKIFGSIIGEAKQPANGTRVFFFQMNNTNFPGTVSPEIVTITCTLISSGADAFCNAGTPPTNAPMGFPPAVKLP